MYIIKCNCNHTLKLGNITSSKHNSLSYDTVYRIERYCTSRNIPCSLIRKIFEYLQCYFMYHIVHKTRIFREYHNSVNTRVLSYDNYKNDKLCIFGCIATSYIMNYRLDTTVNYNLISNIINVYIDSVRINEYDIPKKRLIHSNNILAHVIAMIQCHLTDDEVVYLFTKWQTYRLEYCTSSLSMIMITALMKNKYNEDVKMELNEHAFKVLYKIMYNTQDITPLYKVLKKMELKTMDAAIVTEFQIPPYLMEKLISVADINDIAMNQLYLDKKLIMDHFDSLTKKSLINIISHMKSLDNNTKLLNRIIEKYPSLLHNIICCDVATIESICLYKHSISKEDWVHISRNYDIPENKIFELSKFLDYKRFLFKRFNKQYKDEHPNYYIDWRHNMDLIMSDNCDNTECNIAEDIELGGDRLLI